MIETGMIFFSNNKKGLFPGSFDPFTKGHEGVVLKSLSIFEEVVIGIGVNSRKNYLFDLQKRIDELKAKQGVSNENT
jgi:pantetheine-phosphate adenylyltransferase